MKNNSKQLQYERLQSCHNSWACPSIMSSLSTESALNWGFVRIKETAMLPDCNVLQGFRLDLWSSRSLTESKVLFCGQDRQKLIKIGESNQVCPSLFSKSLLNEDVQRMGLVMSDPLSQSSIFPVI